jgi:hypothetical protein
MSASHLVIDAGVLAGKFEREAFAVRHRLTDHALLQLPRLIELARALPESSVEYNLADLPLEQDYLATPRNGLTIDQTMRQIEDCRSWMVLKNVERDPSYKTLLDECLEEIAPHVRGMSPQLEQREAFVFVSSPQAVTPYHCDPEHNFLLQIRGDKLMTIFDRRDPRAISERQMEDMASGAHRNLPFTEDMAALGRPFQMSPGDGVHVPMYCPHWVRVGQAVSISLSVTFRSLVSVRRDAALRVNARLRKLGLNPVPPTQSPWRDQVKHAVDRALCRMERAARLPRLSHTGG